MQFQGCDFLTDLQAYRNIDLSDKDEKNKSSVLRENILKLQQEFGIVLPDPKLTDNEIRLTSEYSVGACGMYDLYPGMYLDMDVWCKKLSYGDPQGKAMMVKTSILASYSPAKAASIPAVQTGNRHLE